MAGRKNSISSNQSINSDDGNVAVGSSVNVNLGRVNLDAGVTINEDSKTFHGNGSINNGIVGAEVGASYEESHDGNYSKSTITGGVSAGLQGVATGGIEAEYSKSVQENPDGTITTEETISTGVEASVLGEGFNVGTLSTTEKNTIDSKTGDTISITTTTEFTSDVFDDEVLSSSEDLNTTSSEDSAIDAGYGDENGEFDTGTSESDNAISSKMDSDYGATQKSFEQAMEAMSKMGRTTSYETPNNALSNQGSNNQQAVENPNDPNAGKTTSSPEAIQSAYEQAAGISTGGGNGGRDPQTSANSPSSGGNYGLTQDQRNAIGGYGEYGSPSFSASGGSVSPKNTVSKSDSATNDGGGNSSGGGKPIVMDMDGDGVELIPMADNNALFDMDADGYREMMESKSRACFYARDDAFALKPYVIDQGDALLAYDYNEDGQVDERKEIAFVDWKEGARTDLEGLTAFDSNGDSLLNALDAEWDKFVIWQDVDGDGISDEGEVMHIAEAGVEEISLASDETTRDEGGGNTTYGYGEFTFNDGTVHEFADTEFAVSSLGIKENADGSIEVKDDNYDIDYKGFEGEDNQSLALEGSNYAGIFGAAGDDVFRGGAG